MLAFVENWFLRYDKETAFVSGIFVRRKEKTFTCEPLMLYTGLIKLDSYSIRVSIKCGRGPWTVDPLKCGLLPVDFCRWVHFIASSQVHFA